MYIYHQKKTDIVEWFENYKDIDTDNVAQQETYFQANWKKSNK